jgi:phosphoglycerate dehydrogenase-like enzyme
MLKAVYILDPADMERIYPPSVQFEIARLVDVTSGVLSPNEALKRPELLKDMDILFSGWGGPILTREFLEMAPRLKAVFYGAGAIGYMLTDAFYQREIVVTTSNHINAIPVAEYSMAQILLGLKGTWRQARDTRTIREFRRPRLSVAGVYGSRVGLISLSTIGRLVVENLKPFRTKIIAYDPTVDRAEGERLGVEMVSLRQVFATADVVSVHAPVLMETLGMVTGSLLASMKEGATFINTARGDVVREDEMIEVLRRRPDLTAVLDVTLPEPPVPDSPLYELPNVILTPHIAGSLDGECRRLGEFMVDELRRYMTNQPLLGSYSPPKRAAGPLRSPSELTVRETSLSGCIER